MLAASENRIAACWVKEVTRRDRRTLERSDGQTARGWDIATAKESLYEAASRCLNQATFFFHDVA